jgi:hypothetical protein
MGHKAPRFAEGRRRHSLNATGLRKCQALRSKGVLNVELAHENLASHGRVCVCTQNACKDVARRLGRRAGGPELAQAAVVSEERDYHHGGVLLKDMR